MKKIILLVASILTAIQTIANRSVERTNSNPLVLSPSDGIYNHGSHGSHASHCSHYSMTITVKKDSVQNISLEDRNSIIHSLALMHNCAEKDIDIRGLYISKNNGITTQNRGESSMVRYNPSPSEKCLYVSFNKWNRGQYSSFRFSDCSGLTEVHVNRETPPATGGKIFEACESLQTIYVPTGASANYEFDPWNAYKIVEEDVQSGITAVMAEGAANAPVYHLNGRRAGTSKNFSTLPKGIYIVKGKKVLR